MDTQVENFLLNTSNDKSSGIWKLTRAMKQAGYRYKASSDATTKDTTGNPNNDTWGPGVIVGTQTATVAFTLSAPTTTSKGGRVTVTGLAGFATTSPGHFLKITGATNPGNNGTWLITKFISATSVEIENPGGAAETTPGTSTWTELSALNDVFPALGGGAWWCCEGPSTMKIPIGSNVPNGTFIRGENVTQSGAGAATGELLGVVTDSGGQGYLVVAPRKSGTSGGPRGWSTNTITGDVSGATVTPTATAVEFVREIVFWKNTTLLGHIYYQCIDQASEATPSSSGVGRFSLMTGVATTTVCPGGAAGGNPVTNGFPVNGTLVFAGTGGSGGFATGSDSWTNDSTAVNLGKCQFLVANCIEDVGVSQDGTITCAMGTPSVGTYSFEGWFFSRVDEQEEGDVDPYVWYGATPGSPPTRTVSTRGNSTGNTFTTGAGGSQALSLGAPLMGFRRRGFAVGSVANGDGYLNFIAALIGPGQNPAIFTTIATADTVACAVASTRVRDPVYIVGVGLIGGVTFPKMRKGVLRWHFLVSGNAGCDTYDGKRWIQLGSGALPVGSQALVAGPGDGTTTPVNQ